MISKEAVESAKLQIEQYIDAYGLKLVAELVAEIANEKGAHIAENWKDVALAKIWTKRGVDMFNLVSKWRDDL